jgi:electron transfer flavoprotein beta subunit
MMSVAQKAVFELVLLDGPAHGFADAQATAQVLARAIDGIAELDRSHMLLFGGWESASRGQGVTLQMTGERLGIVDQFQGVDRIALSEDGSFEVMERIEGGRHLVSRCAGPPAVLGWATGERGEPRNDPQMGMKNMRVLLPALQKATAAAVSAEGLTYEDVRLPIQQRQTRIVKDMPPEEIAREILAWIR